MATLTAGVQVDPPNFPAVSPMALLRCIALWELYDVFGEFRYRKNALETVELGA